MIIDIRVLFDNYPAEEGFETGWGYSCFIKRGYAGILFDTGADGQKLIKNMQQAEIKPGMISRIVISHPHKDHYGGLKDIASRSKNVQIYAGSSFYDQWKESIDDINIHKVSTEPVEIMNGVYLTGELGDKIKELSLAIDTGGGVVVVTGCAHPGLTKILERVKEILNQNVFALVGGLHLKDYSEEQLRQLVVYLKSEGIKYIAPSHCTGDLARSLFKESIPGFIEAGAGTHIYVGGSCEYI